VILASKSAARAAVLRSAGVPFEAVDSGVDEGTAKADWLAKGAGPREVAEGLAERKAVAVSKDRAGLVIGADQTLDLDGALYDKAQDAAEARVRLTTLRGRRHLLHSALVVANDGAPVWRITESPALSMRRFSDAFLDDYLGRHGAAVLGSVGCYRLEDAGIQLFEKIEGDYFAILGLPLLPLLSFLRAQGAMPS
jgi:septum formation protein